MTDKEILQGIDRLDAELPFDEVCIWGDNGWHEIDVHELLYEVRERIKGWHYPSKGEYPTSETLVLCLLWEAEFAIGCFDIRDKSWIFKDIKGEEIDLSNEYADNITAWMPLPEPPKEEA